MNKKVLSIILIVFIVLNIVLINKVWAVGDIDVVNITNSSTYSPASQSKIDTGIDDATDVATKIIANFIALFRVIGMGVAVIILMTLAAKFIWGSIEQRAEVKKHLIVYVTGAAVLFAGSVLLGYLQEFMKNFN